MWVFNEFQVLQKQIISRTVHQSLNENLNGYSLYMIGSN